MSANNDNLNNGSGSPVPSSVAGDSHPLPGANPASGALGANPVDGLIWSSRVICDTGGRPLLTQQANWEFFESFSTIYSNDTQWVNWELVQNLPTALIKLWSVGKFWNYPQKAHQFAHEVLLWKNSKSSFTNYPEWAHHISWATHQEFFQKIPRNLSTTYSTTYTVISLRVFHETELIESLFWLY